MPTFRSGLPARSQLKLTSRFHRKLLNPKEPALSECWLWRQLLSILGEIGEAFFYGQEISTVARDALNARVS